MSRFLQIVDDGCRGLLPIVRVVRKGLFPLVQIVIPIILIIYAVIDLGKAVIASDEKEIKAAQSRLIKRCIYAAAIFFVVTIVTVIMNIVAYGVTTDDMNTNSWAKCWDAAAK